MSEYVQCNIRSYNTVGSTQHTIRMTTTVTTTTKITTTTIRQNRHTAHTPPKEEEKNKVYCSTNRM